MHDDTLGVISNIGEYSVLITKDLLFEGTGVIGKVFNVNMGQIIVLKLDSSTLPGEAKVMTHNPVTVKLPAGLLKKINFSIQLK